MQPLKANSYLTTYYKRLPTSKEEATFFCVKCGSLEPEVFEVDGVSHYKKQTCACFKEEKQRQQAEKERREYLESMSKHTYTWLGSRWSDEALRQKTFDNFIAFNQPYAYKVAKAYTAKLRGTLILYGTYGTGKTHLLSAICNEALTKYETRSLFCTSPKLFGAMQQCISEKHDYYAFVERAIKTPLLIIDDIDKAKWSEFREEIYFAIVDERVKAEKPIAISTNRLDELEKFVGGAVCSRLKVGQIAIEMVGKDFREDL